jgi:hypothetical protein
MSDLGRLTITRYLLGIGASNGGNDLEAILPELARRIAISGMSINTLGQMALPTIGSAPATGRILFPAPTNDTISGPALIDVANNLNADLTSNTTMYVGFNINALGATRINAGDRGLIWGLERSYDDGSGQNKMEAYLQYQNGDGFVAGSGIRPLMFSINRVTNLPTGTTIAGGVDGVSVNIIDGTGTDTEKSLGRRVFVATRIAGVNGLNISADTLGTSFGANSGNIAQSGLLRFSNNGSAVCGRNAANTGDIGGVFFTNTDDLALGYLNVVDIFFMPANVEKMRLKTSGQLILSRLSAIPAGGNTGIGLALTSTANFGVFCGSGVPTLSAAKGSLYMRSDGSSTTTRAYINTDGGTTWTALTTVA